jgi:mRNA interferase RelE/StbE
LPFSIVIPRAAERDLDRLAGDLFARVDAAILALADDPHPHGSMKLAGAANGYRVRVGDWRILYTVDDAAQTVTVARVRHRREVYRDR